MLYRKGERTRRHNEKEFPYFADIPVPEWGGFGGGALRCIMQWHTWNGVPERPGTGSRKNDRDYARWCFADAATAKMFADMLGGNVSELDNRMRRSKPAPGDNRS